ncbi:MAG: hypothetical protein HY898_11455 [Deltaproteobacteria bacterium]|nr:hypothetical protein [Deltaproteobacteria bacterium]
MKCTGWVRCLTFLFASLAIAGCDGCREPPQSMTEPVRSTQAPAAEPPASTPPAPVASAPVDPVVQVKLLEPGEEPRQSLRYRFHADRPETVWMDLQMAMGMEVGASKQPETQTPGMRMAMRLTPKEISKEGRMRYDFRIESIEVLRDPLARPDMVAAVEQQTRPLVGLSGSAEVDPRGMTHAVQFVPLAGTPNPAFQGLIDNLRQSIRNISSPLPEEPVGKGARWEISIPLETPGIKLTQISTHSLKEFKVDKGRIEVAMRQDAPVQPVAFPGMHPGATANLESLVSAGSGWTDFDLNKLVPESSVSMASTMTAKVDEMGTSQQLKVTMRVVLKTTAKAPKPEDAAAP